MNKPKITIHGHRGSRGTHPENTIPSFAEAWAAGAQFVELDVHLTRDGHVIVCHDPMLSSKLCRDSAGHPLEQPIPIRELTLEDIRSYDCGSQKLREFPEQQLQPGARIPTLEELIVWKKSAAPGLRLNVEIKTGTAAPDRLAEATLGVLKKHDCLGESLVQSFDFDVVRAVRRLDEGVRLSCLFERPADFARIAVDCRAQVVAAHFPLIDQALARSCTQAGLEVLPWTVNEANDWQRMLGLGIHSIITDYPRKLSRFLAADA